MGNSINGRLDRLEQAQQQDANAGSKMVRTDGAEYGLDPVDGGWTVLVRDGKVVKAWGRVSPLDWR